MRLNRKKEKNNAKSYTHDKIQKSRLAFQFPVFKNALKFLGPGLITGASDDDPSGIATYSQAGAKFGLGLLWLAIFQYPLMIVIQEMCARIGLATGDGIKKMNYTKTIKTGSVLSNPDNSFICVCFRLH
jgi:hypothetical protein